MADCDETDSGSGTARCIARVADVDRVDDVGQHLALSVVLFSLHLVLADYSSGRKEGKLSETLSFNAAISASVVLASRLETDSDTFTLLALAVVLFAPTPPPLREGMVGGR